MKRVFELVQQCSWEEVWEALAVLYPSQVKSKAGYCRVFRKIPDIVPKLTDQQLMTRECIKEEISERGSCEEGMRLDFLPDNDVFILDESTPASEHYSLLYVPWPELIGLKVPDLRNSRYGAAGIVAHCLYEMTFDGYSEKKVDWVRWKAAKDHISSKRHHRILKRNYFRKYCRFLL